MTESASSMRWMTCAVVLLCGSGVAMAEAPVGVSDAVRGGAIDSSTRPHPGTNVLWGRAVAVVDAPAATVMSVLQDYGGYKDFLPNFQASRVLSQRGSAALVYLQVSVLHGASKIWVEVKLRERPAQGETRTIEGTMTRGNVDRFEAVWQVTPFDQNRSLVTFQLLVDPNLPIPASLVNDENLKNARKALRALRATLAGRAQRSTLAQREIVSIVPPAQ